MITKEERFNKIIEENEKKIARICKYYAKCEEDTKDMYQEVLINIWKSLDSYRGDAAISTWIYRIAINTSLSQSGKSYKQLKFKVDIDTQHLGSLLDEDETELKKLYEDRLEALQTEINQFSVIDKALITLMLEDLSSKEIANIIGLTEPNIRVKIHRIKETLRESLCIKKGMA